MSSMNFNFYPQLIPYGHLGKVLNEWGLFMGIGNIFGQDRVLCSCQPPDRAVFIDFSNSRSIVLDQSDVFGGIVTHVIAFPVLV